MGEIGIAPRVCAAGLIVAAATTLSGCVSTVAGIAMRDHNAAPSDVQPFKSSDLKKLLLSIGEINTIMGTSRIEVTSEVDSMTDSSDKVSDQDCLGAIFGAEEKVYKGSGWTAVQDQIAREPDDDNDHWIQQSVVLYPDAAAAARFVETSRSQWQQCTGSPIEVGSEDSTSSWDLDDVAADKGMITQTSEQQDADGWGCQHALVAVSNVTGETWACGYSVTDEAASMAEKITANAAHR